MCYNGLNNMFFPLCQINDNHSVTSPSHTKKKNQIITENIIKAR